MYTNTVLFVGARIAFKEVVEFASEGSTVASFDDSLALTNFVHIELLLILKELLPLVGEVASLSDLLDSSVIVLTLWQHNGLVLGEEPLLLSEAGSGGTTVGRYPLDRLLSLHCIRDA